MANVDPQLWLGSEAPEADRLKPVSNDQQVFCKPRHGGLWTSTYTDDDSSAWLKWCEAENFNSPDKLDRWLIYPDPDAQVYVVDCMADLETLWKCHKLPPLVAGSFPRINWRAVARAYDGVRLTEKGQWATRLTQPLSMYGWDCESTFWFRWFFEKVVKL